MTTTPLGQFGIRLALGPGHLDRAAELESNGYSALWVAGGELASLDPLTEILRATTRAAVVPGIISLDAHSPDDVIQIYAESEEETRGRLMIGLGGPQQIARGALRALSEAADRLDAADPPVVTERRMLAALGPRKLELARQRFAGAITLLVTPEDTRRARALLGDSATLAVHQMLVADTDSDRARRAAREPLRFLTTVGGYAANFRRMGYADADIADLSDRLVDGLVAWGDDDSITARLRAHHDAGADHVVLSVLDSGRPGASPPAVARRLASMLMS
ncbi:putative F420-dependent oxidoreductase [Antricoccus suffuscus]|uniref:Putative F420-dependent oxidoreductase n=1 Tax=Antricoccus suffuscus TaxID=1629062 RepID=A0A2T0ZYW5_9ACTN|nr:TIGR03620 family F420-dependent LLM class oxidoreductase [Antricoccus suffuscus]PRZ41523.1 putative F420-dependent oxidoreductase [Antricoccus suffuscus]